LTWQVNHLMTGDDSTAACLYVCAHPTVKLNYVSALKA
jgi:hypothetical protein